MVFFLRTDTFRTLLHHRLVAAVAASAASAAGTALATGAGLLEGLHQHVEGEDHRQQRQRAFRCAGDERAVGQEVRVVRRVQRDKGDDCVDRQRHVADDRATHTFGTGHHTGMGLGIRPL